MTSKKDTICSHSTVQVELITFVERIDEVDRSLLYRTAEFKRGRFRLMSMLKVNSLERAT